MIKGKYYVALHIVSATAELVEVILLKKYDSDPTPQPEAVFLRQDPNRVTERSQPLSENLRQKQID